MEEKVGIGWEVLNASPRKNEQPQPSTGGLLGEAVGGIRAPTCSFEIQGRGMGETKPHRRPLFSFYLKQIDSKILQVFLKSKTTGFPVIFSFFF